MEKSLDPLRGRKPGITMKLLLVRLYLLVALTLTFAPEFAQAGAGTIAVFDGSGKLCEEQGRETMVVRLTSTEAIASLKNWLHDRPQDLVITEKHVKAPGWDQKNLQSFLNIAFSGYIKFCGHQERQQYFSAMTDALRVPQSNERVYVLVLLHSRSKTLLNTIEAQLAAHPADQTYLANLEKAKRLILYQNKTPEPYPTEQTVKRIEMRLKQTTTPP